MLGYLESNVKNECFGCEACVQVCGKKAITMQEDSEGFRYPVIDESKCVSCGLCKKVCPYSNMPTRHSENKYVFGGYNQNAKIRSESTSGGAFSAIVDAWCDENYVIFGAQADGLKVFHSYIDDKSKLSLFRKSKYSQSIIGTAYSDAKHFLKNGKKVLFSGTPCQIAGLKSFLGDKPYDNLLTIEVICEGVPSPLFVRKFDEHMKNKYSSSIEELDYRYTDPNSEKHPTKGKWDFEVMRVKLKSGRIIKTDRWFNPFWSIWLNHLMSRPSCYKCPFTTTARTADISLGDLWGVHLYCPELYGHNGGSSLIVCNTEKGKQALKKARHLLFGHELEFETALKYQSPMRKTISQNPEREKFLTDIKTMNYVQLCKKWAKKPDAKLLWSKYVWGNRQKIAMWNIKQRFHIK